MKKTIDCVAAALLTSALPVAAATFPLEWNATYDTSVPREVEILPGKLVGMGLMRESDGFKVRADGKPLAVKALNGKEPGSVRLRFTVPQGTQALACETCTDGAKAGASDGGLFAGALSGPAGWQFKGGTIEKTQKGLLLKGTKNRSYATFEVPVPESLAGKGVVQEIEVTSRAKLVWGGVVKIEQLDGNGTVLPETLCDIRWTSHMRPPEKTALYVDEGHVHPRAKRLRASFELRPLTTAFDDYGRPIKDKSILLPALEVSRIEVRAAEPLPFPKWNDEFFAPGVSGRAGDFALRSGGPDSIGFFHQATTRAGWTQGYQFRDERDRALPSGDGTIEAWFRPDVSDKGNVPLFQLHQGIRTRMLKKEGMGEALGLYYDAGKKKLSFSIKDWQRHAYKGDVKGVEIPVGKWTHVAVAWRCGGTAEVFVGGRKVLSLPIPEFEAVPLQDKSLNEANDLWAQQLFVGCTHHATRGKDGFGKDAYFDGAIDLVRASSVVRYSDDFAPPVALAADADTRSLFAFDRTFDGVCGGGFGFVPASISARRDRVSHRLCGGWYRPEENLPSNDPFRVLDTLNYPVMPRVDEYLASRKSESASFTVKAGDEMKVASPTDLYMDYVEIENLSQTEALLYPIAVRRGALDPRSFGDLRDSLGGEGLMDKGKVNRVFQYAISASDYFMNHQADFAPGSDSPRPAISEAMIMLNSYCGFECGPLNNLTLNMLACVAGCPTTPTGGYGHAFEQVFFDGKNHIYDLSAQKFFPSFDNETSVYLGEAANQPGVFNRVKGSCGHFIRQGSRGSSVGAPDYQEKVAMILNPGERFRVWTGNDGQFNNLTKWHATGTYYPLLEANPAKENFDYADVVGAKKGTKWVLRRDRVFPHYSTGVLSFDGCPTRGNPAFEAVGADSFCYRVRSCYPITLGVYEARLADGRAAELELSTDGGKTFSSVPMRNGRATLQYRVKARHDYLVRVKATIGTVARFTARTECEVNPRTYPGWLKGGGDGVVFKAENDAPARVTFAWRRAAQPIEVKGGAYSGTLPGFERQLVVVKPGTAARFAVAGTSDGATVRAFGPVRADMRGGCLEIASDPCGGDLIARGDDLPDHGATDTAFGAVEIDDGGAQKALTVLVSPDARLATAESVEVSGAAAKVAADASSVQGRVIFKKSGDKATFRFATPLPAGRYVVLPLVRYGGHEKNAAFVMMRDPVKAKKKWSVAKYINGNLDYFKANYAHPGERARWKWDSAMRGDIQSSYNGWMYRVFDLPKTDTLEFFVEDDPGSGVEMAAVLVVPDPDLELRLDMRKLLSGLNCDPVRINFFEK
ncbi:MAG: LamG domain-containing protein [Kiritimatiellae bacterium]|nr:LamG domain-containing protein [Kiritimatiellia bacterium]